MLGVSRTATFAAIRQAYLAQVRQCHPDKHPLGGHGRFQRLQQAFEKLRDDKSRAQWDLTQAGMARRAGC